MNIVKKIILVLLTIVIICVVGYFASKYYISFRSRQYDNLVKSIIPGKSELIGRIIKGSNLPHCDDNSAAINIQGFKFLLHQVDTIRYPNSFENSNNQKLTRIDPTQWQGKMVSLVVAQIRQDSCLAMTCGCLNSSIDLLSIKEVR